MGRLRTMRPQAEGMVSRKTRPSEDESVERKEGMSPRAAKREMAGSVAVPMATPKTPMGSYIRRKA